MCYVNCGHPRIVHWRAREACVTLLETTAVPLGFSDTVQYDERQVSLEPGDLILFYSDGITDLHRPEGGRMGVDGFAEWVGPRAHLPLDELTSELAKLRDASPGEGSARDDFTCVAVRYVGCEQPTEEGLTLWSDATALRKFRAYVGTVLEQTEFSQRERGEILLAVQEAASNAVRHARPEHGALVMNILARPTAEGIRVDLKYPGVEFDASDVPPPVLDGSSEGGFGIAIIRKCMDRVTFGSKDGLNHLVMEKRRAS
jgi:sigma-B regulation protein RsbU (phosphoserine phosphatase)